MNRGKPIENLPVFVYMHGYSDGGGDNNIAVRYHNAIVFRLLQLRDDPEHQSNHPGAADTKCDQSKGGNYSKGSVGRHQGEDKWSQWNIPTWDISETPRTII